MAWPLLIFDDRVEKMLKLNRFYPINRFLLTL